MHYVILGRSAAGITAARTIREQDTLARITVITGERTKPYYRPLLPLVLSGKKNEQEIEYPDDPFAGRDIEVVLGTVVRVDPGKRAVLLASGDELTFDALLLAAGASAIRPSLPGIGLSGIFPLRSAAHASAVRTAAAAARSIVVLGGGLVGIKAAIALREAKVRSGAPGDVTVVEMLPEILNNRLDRPGAAMVRAAVEQEGVTVITGARVAGIAGRHAVTGIKLASGRTITADLVVVAAGARPNISFLRMSGIGTRRGVLVDESLRTNVPGVFAAGDIAEGRDLITNARSVSGLWTNAVEMGRLAGLNMTGRKSVLPGFLPVMNASEIAGVPFVSAGLIEPSTRHEVISRTDESGYWKLVLDRDFLVGAVLVGNIDRAGIYTNLIRNRIPIARARNKITRRAASYADFFPA